MDGSNGSNGNIVSLLERLLEEQVKTREELVGLRGEVVGVREDTRGGLTGLREDTRVALDGLREDIRGGLIGVRADMNRGFAQVNARIDNVLSIAGGHHDDHEERIQVLEERVLGKSSG